MKLKASSLPNQPNKTVFVMYNEKIVKDRGFTDKDTADAWIEAGIKNGKITWRNSKEEGWSFRIKNCGYDCLLVDRRGNPL